MKKIYSLLVVLFATTWCFGQHQIIPAPVSYESGTDSLLVEGKLSVYLTEENDFILPHLEEFKKELSSLGIQLNTNGAEEGDKTFALVLNDSVNEVLGEEGYQLNVDATGITMVANTQVGLFNGLQTVRQLFPIGGMSPNESAGQVLINSCSITDYPRFSWRGLMLDVSRHFFTVDEVKAFIDQMARYKYNVFHWHLTDDEGWRIEIKTFPKLTEVGAWRVPRYGRFGAGRAQPKRSEKASEGGFYTQEEIKDVIAYASARNITIVPEIDVPGHSMALLAAYPQLSTKKEFKHVNPGAKFVDWHGNGKFTMNIENTLNPADPAVYAFLDMVFGEVADLFPGEYIHMGGDECYHGFWEADEKVRAFMAENEIADTDELQSYFVKRMEKIISSKGKKMIGWDEILQGGLADGAAVMSWRGMRGGIEAARMGHPVVMTPKSHTYLDYTQGDYSVENRIHGDLSLKKAYEFDPMPNTNLFVDLDSTLVLGGQGNVWTEAIPTMPYAFYMTYPRAWALSEVFWSNKGTKDWESFLRRTETHIKRFDAQGINVAKTIYEPVVKVFRDGRNLMCTIKTAVDGLDIYYTIDNTYPVTFGTKYDEPFLIPPGDLNLRVQCFKDGEPVGRLLIISREELDSRAKK